MLQTILNDQTRCLALITTSLTFILTICLIVSLIEIIALYGSPSIIINNSITCSKFESTTSHCKDIHKCWICETEEPTDISFIIIMGWVLVGFFVSIFIYIYNLLYVLDIRCMKTRVLRLVPNVQIQPIPSAPPLQIGEPD